MIRTHICFHQITNTLTRALEAREAKSVLCIFIDVHKTKYKIQKHWNINKSRIKNLQTIWSDVGELDSWCFCSRRGGGSDLCATMARSDDARARRTLGAGVLFAGELAPIFVPPWQDQTMLGRPEASFAFAVHCSLVCVWNMYWFYVPIACWSGMAEDL